MQSCDERMLLERAKAYDSAALGDLYDRYAGKIYAYIYYRVGDEVLAEDLTANVFIKMLDAVKSTRAWDMSFSGWLYRIAHNAIVDHFRRNSHDKGLPLDERLVATTDDPVKTVEQLMASNVVKAAIANLTEEQQTVIVLKFFEGLSNLEVANIMDKTEGAIKSLQYRALAALRRCIEESGGKDA